MTEFETYLAKWNEIGYVLEVYGSLVVVDGLPKAKMHEVILFESGGRGQVFSLQKGKITVLLLTAEMIAIGIRVVRSGGALHIPVGQYLKGMTVDALAQPLKTSAVTQTTKDNTYEQSVDVRPKGIADRRKIITQFISGVTIVDMLIPLGKGQRQLVVGDRKTGKTAFLQQCLLTQTQNGTICIYAAIGKQQSEIESLLSFLTAQQIDTQTIVVASTRNDPEGLIYTTPYTAMTIAEYFRDQGQDVLLILDDLTTHAKAYRTLSLLAKRFPGRSSYPANIFYTHARLLERSGNFKQATGDVAITTLPVAETTNGNLSGYIQTNLMSMTDGHIFFDVNLYAAGRRPAINPFVSVSRVGRQTQTSLSRSIAREVTSFLTLLEQSEKYSHFGAEASASTKATLATGERVIAFFNQATDATYPLALQLFLFTLVWNNVLNTTSLAEQGAYLTKVRQAYATQDATRNFIDDIIQQADSLNTLLAVIEKQSEKIRTLVQEGRQ